MNIKMYSNSNAIRLNINLFLVQSWPFFILHLFIFLNLPISGTLTVEEVYRDRDQFAALVREVAAPDVGSMGIEILSFTIKDVTDDVDYLSSLGKSQTANVRRDADVGVAQAGRDAGIRVIQFLFHISCLLFLLFCRQ